MIAKQLIRATARLGGVGALVAMTVNAASPGAVEFRKQIEPVLEEYCYDCHGDGMDKGGVAFDAFDPDKDLATSQDLWWRALKNLRADLMPPPKKPRPSPKQSAQIERWIKSRVFLADAKNPDPGRVTIRRLNRVEYRNTIRDLVGVDYDTSLEFPPDDTGYGFDNIGDVLTLPPILLEKYLEAAQDIVRRAVPQASRMVQEQIIPGRSFQSPAAGGNGDLDEDGGPLALSFHAPVTASNIFKAGQAGKYQLGVDLVVNGRPADNALADNECRVVLKVDNAEQLRREFRSGAGRAHHYDLEMDWAAGNHEIKFELRPLTSNEARRHESSVQITSVTVRGPLAESGWVRPRNYDRYFPKTVPAEARKRRAYAGELLGKFASRAYRRPVDGRTRERLVGLAESIYTQPDKTFEQGVSQAMVAVLASPRFLFREERVESGRSAQGYAFVDEYSLASRLSYFFWSSMPDDELFRLADEKKLRKQLPAQVKRMQADPKSEALVRNFTGQWLRTRDMESVAIDARAVLGREEGPNPELDRARKRLEELKDKPNDKLTAVEKEELAKARTLVRQHDHQPLRAELTPEIRQAMRRETEGVFEYVLREDRSLLELVDSDYSFLNGPLAAFYGLTNITGNEMRLTKLPPDSPRGGILTEGTVLTVTSNPTRTSPVKRGVFILDNILGTPPPPPPPNLPPLEAAAGAIKGHPPTLRETLAKHRESPECSSCHNRMDPLGLAFENFNALGLWRDQELGGPVDASGRLITGEEFNGVKELKRLLAEKYATSFYRTVTEKLMTYALGRGLEYYDVQTVDQILARLEKSGGRPSALLLGVVESAPFQKVRTRARTANGGGTQPGSGGTAKAGRLLFDENAGLQSGSDELTVWANVQPGK